MDYLKHFICKLVLILLYNAICIISVNAQEELLKIESGIQISNSINPDPAPGTIRWTGNDFEGWNGVIWVSLTGDSKVGSISDFDGNEYRTLNIGSQIWMVDNLAVTKFNDGSPINHGAGSNWVNANVSSIPSYCWYNDQIVSKDTFGALYNWYTTSSTHTNGKNVCPIGWHLPTVVDWEALADHLGGLGFAGGKMKSTGTELWSPPNAAATNESGFSGLPGGARTNGGFFHAVHEYGFWWAKDEYSFSSGNSFFLIFDDSKVSTSLPPKGQGISIRCVSD